MAMNTKLQNVTIKQLREPPRPDETALAQRNALRLLHLLDDRQEQMSAASSSSIPNI